MNCLGSRILIPFSRSVALSKITPLFFAITSASGLSISITLCFVFVTTYTSVVCCIVVDNYYSTSIIFSSLASFYDVYVFTKCYSIASLSSDSSMNIRSTNVAPSPIRSFACQRLLLLHKNSTIDIPIVSMS